MLELAKAYNKAVQEEGSKTLERFQIESVGKLDSKKHLQESVEQVGGGVEWLTWGGHGVEHQPVLGVDDERDCVLSV
jgi:hypothetical protein